MAVPRPVLIAILGLALCVTALIAVRGLEVDEEESVSPAPIPTAPVQKSESSAPGRPRSVPSAEASTATPTEPAEGGAKSRAADSDRKLSRAEVARLKETARVAAVARALGQNDVVVLFFSRPGAADDTGARRSVRQFRKMDGVQFFAPDFARLDDYRPVLAGVGVAQVPAIVIVKPGKKAQLVEGYVDSKTLRQQVEDSLR